MTSRLIPIAFITAILVAVAFLSAAEKPKPVPGAGSGLKPAPIVHAFPPNLDILERKLNNRLSISCSGIPLQTFLPQLGRRAGVAIVLDSGAFDSITATPSTRISCEFEDMPLHSILNQTLRPHGLTWTLHGGSLFVTTPEEADAYLFRRAYKVSDLVPVASANGQLSYDEDDCKNFLEFVQNTLKKNSWAENGGQGVIANTGVGRSVVFTVIQNYEVHHELAGYFAAMREVARNREEMGPPPERTFPPPSVAMVEVHPTPPHIEEALRQCGDFRFHKIPLHDAIQTLHKQFKVNFNCDTTSLADAGITPETPVSCNLHDISLEVGLRLMLRSIGATWSVKDAMICITTPEVDASNLCTRLYDVTDLVMRRDDPGEFSPDYDSLIESIEILLEPNSWQDNGGPGSCDVVPVGSAHVMAVLQTRQNHEKLMDWLEQNRAIAQQRRDKLNTRGEIVEEETPPTPVEKLEKALQQPIDMKFKGEKLIDVMQMLRNRYGINYYLDTKSLEAVGVTSETRITCNLHAMPIESCLKIILSSEVLKYHGAAWTMKDDMVFITSDDEAGNVLFIKAYDVADLLTCSDPPDPSTDNDVDSLIDMIEATLTPISWQDCGGPGGITPGEFDEGIVLSLRQTYEIHQQFGALLKKLREVVRNRASLGPKRVGRAAPPTVPMVELSPPLVECDKKLRQRINLVFTDTPLVEVMQKLQKRYGIEVLFDTEELSSSSVSLQTKITCRMSGVTIGEGLSKILQPIEAGWYRQDSTVCITTAEEAAHVLSIRVYDVSDLVNRYRHDEHTDNNHAERGSRHGGKSGDCGNLIELILSIYPNTWQDNGGQCSITSLSIGETRVLVISQRDEVHDKILNLIKQVRSISKRHTHMPLLRSNIP